MEAMDLLARFLGWLAATAAFTLIALAVLAVAADFVASVLRVFRRAKP